MTIEIDKEEILLQHGIVKGIKKTLKRISNLFDSNVEEAKRKLEDARREERHYGMFDDCGSSYRAWTSEAEGALSEASSSSSIVRTLVADLTRESKYLKLLKHEFSEKYGEKALAALNNSILKIGTDRAKRESKAQRERKVLVKGTMHIAQVLTGTRTRSLLYELKRKGAEGSDVNVHTEIHQLLKKCESLESKIRSKYHYFESNNLKALEMESAENTEGIRLLGREFVSLFVPEFIDAITMEDEQSKKLYNFLGIINKNLV